MIELGHAIDVLVVGGGPAGIATACAAAEHGRQVLVVDEGSAPGGQIWRGGASHDRASRRWLDRIRHQSRIQFLSNATVVAAPDPGVLLAQTPLGARLLKYRTLVVAVGARELFLPFPSWTLPGVFGVGGLQALVKGGWPIAGKRVVVAGSGPLLLAVSAALKDHGAHIVLIAEQADASKVNRFGLSLLAQPRKLAQAFRLLARLRGVRRAFSAWPVGAFGSETIERVALSTGGKTWEEPCDILACGFGLAPNIELPALLGCKLKDGFVEVDDFQQTTLPEVYCAGEPTGIGGVDSALVEGTIAGLAAAGQTREAQRYFHARSAAHRFRDLLARTFALRDELKALAQDDTIVCRCEDVSYGRVRARRSWRDAKLQTRCGMGPCQGRVCGAATRFLFGWSDLSVRPPVVAAPLSCLIAEPAADIAS